MISGEMLLSTGCLQCRHLLQEPGMRKTSRFDYQFLEMASLVRGLFLMPSEMCLKILGSDLWSTKFSKQTLEVLPHSCGKDFSQSLLQRLRLFQLASHSVLRHVRRFLQPRYKNDKKFKLPDFQE
jgi:hypothetical protein